MVPGADMACFATDRPSAYYAYHLSDDAEESLDTLEANDFAWPKSQDMHIYDVDEIADGGVDQLGEGHILLSKLPRLFEFNLDDPAV